MSKTVSTAEMVQHLYDNKEDLPEEWEAFIKSIHSQWKGRFLGDITKLSAKQVWRVDWLYTQYGGS